MNPQRQHPGKRPDAHPDAKDDRPNDRFDGAEDRGHGADNDVGDPARQAAIHQVFGGEKAENESEGDGKDRRQQRQIDGLREGCQHRHQFLGIGIEDAFQDILGVGCLGEESHRLHLHDDPADHKADQDAEGGLDLPEPAPFPARRKGKLASQAVR